MMRQGLEAGSGSNAVRPAAMSAHAKTSPGSSSIIAAAGGTCSSAAQWLSRGTEVCATFWKASAPRSTMPSEKGSASSRKYFCHGVWLAGIG